MRIGTAPLEPKRLTRPLNLVHCCRCVACELRESSGQISHLGIQEDPFAPRRQPDGKAESGFGPIISAWGSQTV